jgi:hypothetical protein
MFFDKRSTFLPGGRRAGPSSLASFCARGQRRDWGTIPGMEDLAGCLKSQGMLKQPELYLHRLSEAAQRIKKLNQAWGLGDLSLSFVGLSPSFEEAVEFVRARGIEVVEKRVIP